MKSKMKFQKKRKKKRLGAKGLKEVHPPKIGQMTTEPAVVNTSRSNSSPVFTKLHEYSAEFLQQNML